MPVSQALPVSVPATPRSIGWYAVLVAMLVVLTGGCATRAGLAEKDPAVLFDGADCLLVLPVDANRALIELLVSGFLDSGDTSRLLDRTRRVLVAVYSDESESSGWQARLFASGDFPSSLSRFAFPPSKGWVRRSTKGLPAWYEAEQLAVSLPRSGQAFAVSGKRAGEGVQDLLRKNASLDASVVHPLPERLRQHQFFGDEILVWTEKPGVLAASIVGPLIRLPLDSAELILVPSADQYLLSARLVLSDERTVRAVRTVLLLAFGADFKSEGRVLFIEKVPVRTATLAETLSRFIYF